MVEPLAGGGIRVNARMSVMEVNEILGAELPEGDWDSIGGLVYHSLGRPPAEGEEIAGGRWVLRAERMQGRRIGRVRITAAAGAPDSGQATSATTGAAPGQVAP